MTKKVGSSRHQSKRNDDKGAKGIGSNRGPKNHGRPVLDAFEFVFIQCASQRHKPEWKPYQDLPPGQAIGITKSASSWTNTVPSTT